MPQLLRQKWAMNRPALNLFLTIPGSWTAELMAHTGFDCLTLDLQHGLISADNALAMLQAISTTPTVPLVRLPWNEPSVIMKMLDAGAAGLICPMIDTAEEAARFARACRYPPEGIRSFGPIRASLLTEGDYFQQANRKVLAFAMIETASSLNMLEAIAATPGLDGLFVGPFDLSVSLGLKRLADIHDPALAEALKNVLAACRRHQLVPAIYTTSIANAAELAAMGFRLISIGDDTAILAEGAQKKLAELKKGIP
ncbi:MAG: hypothetical protein KDC66_16245 [Phaeodactylibacter sp.]|nr:hypothetical protein [Phaeodactylibacter sp.]MCB9273657.1 2,4-dihydroxyhept-2-ene-1,7-dioic acid aldolase [Lewinellaceae bacterium]